MELEFPLTFPDGETRGGETEEEKEEVNNNKRKYIKKINKA